MLLRRPPQNPKQAIASLEPIVNLARLRTRAGDGPGAWSLLETLHQAITTRTDINIDGIHIPAACLTRTPDLHRELSTWLWTVLLADGGRALTLAGRWAEAHRRLEQHRGVGRRMLDGRQIAVLAHAVAGDHDTALTLLEDTERGEAWEAAVTTCLTMLCRPSSAGPADLRTVRQQLEPPPAELVVFHTRLGLCLLDALPSNALSAVPYIAAGLLRHAVTDGYAARDLLNHPLCRSIATGQQLQALTDVVGACGLDAGAIPADSLGDITAALDQAGTLLAGPGHGNQIAATLPARSALTNRATS
ncbi:hypothetical protein JQS43_14335 [Natronosporangium hydrolyticum]|uniref:Uncharacterized protein n=1 Tax=Natronosporangium hydrolyticum TaxID=2811111 RepID=A0A895YGN9_9ACTN|nr:hypothetical protein [Natronosporangium hydrolyticum]QSB12858.1 hypothetical protein JQS43_14335 [Natronosporangium hydrolyticum]